MPTHFGPRGVPGHSPPCHLRVDTLPNRHCVHTHLETRLVLLRVSSASLHRNLRPEQCQPRPRPRQAAARSKGPPRRKRLSRPTGRKHQLRQSIRISRVPRVPPTCTRGGTPFGGSAQSCRRSALGSIGLGLPGGVATQLAMGILPRFVKHGPLLNCWQCEFP